MNTIAVWNTAYLGDTVLTLPLVQTLAKAFPNASIDLYIRKGFESLFTLTPRVQNVIGYAKPGSSLVQTKKLIQGIRSKQYDLWVNAHPSVRSSLITVLSKAKIRIGYKTNLLQKFCCHYTVQRQFGILDEVDRLLELVSPLNIDRSNYERWPNIVVSSKALDQATAFWDNNISSGKTLGINPGAAWATKRWPFKKFAEVAKIAIDNNVHVIFFGSTEDLPKTKEIIRLAQLEQHPRAHNLTGKLTLQTLAAHIKNLDCYLTNDSGPMHIAWAQHTPVTAIFGPTVKEFGFTPKGPKATIMEVDLPCRPCSLHGSATCPKKHFKCMLDIDPVHVWEDIKKKFETPR